MRLDGVVRHERADREVIGAPVDSAESFDPVDRDHVTGQGRFALAVTHHQIAATGDRPGAVGERGERLVERECSDEPHGCIASQTRSAVIGSRRTGVPSRRARAFEMAAAVATLGASASPLAPRGPASGVAI